MYYSIFFDFFQAQEFDKMMNTVDLFAGCGGMSLGFQNAGFDLVAAFEFWDVAAECYQNSFPY